jgi:hypothetical protein
MQHLRGTSDSARRCPLRSAALATAETTPLRGHAGEPRSFTGATRPTRKPSDADRRLETVDSDPADNARRIVDALERG